MPMNGDHEQAVIEGCACVRLVESVNFLLTMSVLNENDAAILRKARTLAKERLRALVAEQHPEVIAQILAASDKLSGPVGEIDLN